MVQGTLRQLIETPLLTLATFQNSREWLELQKNEKGKNMVPAIKS